MNLLTVNLVLSTFVFWVAARLYVLAHFDANDTAPMPILYKLAA